MSSNFVATVRAIYPFNISTTRYTVILINFKDRTTNTRNVRFHLIQSKFEAHDRPSPFSNTGAYPGAQTPTHTPEQVP